jgi:hypothetical protein
MADKPEDHPGEAIRDIPDSCTCIWKFDTEKWRWIRTGISLHCPLDGIYKGE